MIKLQLFTLAFIAHFALNAQTIETIAGTGTTGYSGNGGPATLAQLNTPSDLIYDASGNLYVTDFYNNVIRKIDRYGIITVFAGNGTGSYTGDGFPATAAGLNHPCAMLFDHYGEMILSDNGNNVIRKIDTLGIITTIAGNGTSGSFGDGGPATNAQFHTPNRMSYDMDGNIYVADYGNHKIRKISTTGIISTVAGTGYPGFNSDGIAATLAQISQPTDVVFDHAGNMYICDQLNQRIRKVDSLGIISTVAGNGGFGSTGDGGMATDATFSYASSIFIDDFGNIIITDSYGNSVRKVDTLGYISTIVGNGTAGYFGDGGPATDAELQMTWYARTDKCGNMVIADAGNGVIRKVNYFSILPPIVGPSSVSTDSTIILTNAVPGGSWSATPSSSATIDSATGVLTASAEASGIIIVNYTGDCGTATDTITIVPALSTETVVNNDLTMSLVPNPSKGIFSITGIMDVAISNNLSVIISDVEGQVYAQKEMVIYDRSFTLPVDIGEDTPAGLYFVRVTVNGKSIVMKATVTK